MRERPRKLMFKVTAVFELQKIECTNCLATGTAYGQYVAKFGEVEK